jgi:hypothetical protein
MMRVDDGTRTRDRRDHNPELYQLSYVHRGGPPSVVGAQGSDDLHEGFQAPR